MLQLIWSHKYKVTQFSTDTVPNFFCFIFNNKGGNLLQMCSVLRKLFFGWGNRVFLHDNVKDTFQIDTVDNNKKNYAYRLYLNGAGRSPLFLDRATAKCATF